MQRFSSSKKENGTIRLTSYSGNPDRYHDDRGHSERGLITPAAHPQLRFNAFQPRPLFAKARGEGRAYGMLMTPGGYEGFHRLIVLMSYVQLSKGHLSCLCVRLTAYSSFCLAQLWSRLQGFRQDLKILFWSEVHKRNRCFEIHEDLLITRIMRKPWFASADLKKKPWCAGIRCIYCYMITLNWSWLAEKQCVWDGDPSSNAGSIITIRHVYKGKSWSLYI